MSNVHITPSEVFLLLAGILLLISLPELFGGVFTLWVVAKVLYGIGIVLFLIDR